ncbi:Hsp20/alpha crystallin family protein [Kitasatospora sp. RB6PN24]|uniref:Hsp20/alpha crystallin family protein n=1 Tax=Kitasatospora humi TaxID=2893891 RepID=UPI001E4541EB|nr:Hsp20/alpha crystallin family protein [Kitasatospora humi]MCC9307906.1 Hsp20/alpha crystallin family protein [Kitasatospora humi]
MAGEMSKRARHPFSQWPDFSEWLEGFPFGRESAEQYIRVEEFDEEGSHVIQAELPGIDPARDAEITVVDGVLTIKAERSEEHREKQRSEFRYGSFTRSIPLPSQAREEDVRATYADGILTVTVPMDITRPTARRIEISGKQ